MKTSPAGYSLIKLFESVQYKAYICPAGVWTIGYGHTGPDVVSGMKITQPRAETLLQKDIVKFENAITGSVKVELNQNQFDALVSFVFNIGIGAFKESTLLRRLNNKENPNTVAAEELPRWNKSNGAVLSGLVRRRLAEVELFCQAPPQKLSNLLTLKAKCKTWLKKSIKPAVDLPNNEKASIGTATTIRNCNVLDRKDKHAYVDLGFGLGKWWLYEPHWDGLETKPEVNPYATQGDLRYLRNFPYFYQTDNGPEGWRQCQSSSIAMCLKYLDVPGINDDVDYLKIVRKYGDTTWREPHFEAMKELGVTAKFIKDADAQDVKDQIDKGLPVVAGILHHGTVDYPAGGGHFVVITGYGKDHWLVQDPYGELDLIEGVWVKTGPTSGKNIHYSFKNMNPRLFVGGGANGWCWVNFKRLT
jgi:lysozyme